MFKSIFLISACLLGMFAFNDSIQAQQTGIQLQIGVGINRPYYPQPRYQTYLVNPYRYPVYPRVILPPVYVPRVYYPLPVYNIPVYPPQFNHYHHGY